MKTFPDFYSWRFGRFHLMLPCRPLPLRRGQRLISFTPARAVCRSAGIAPPGPSFPDILHVFPFVLEILPSHLERLVREVEQSMALLVRQAAEIKAALADNSALIEEMRKRKARPRAVKVARQGIQS